MTDVDLGAADLRAAIARRQIRLYVLAAEVGVHPGRLGMMLGGRLTLPAALARRVSAAIEKAAYASPLAREN